MVGPCRRASKDCRRAGCGTDFEAEALGRGYGDEALDFGIGEGSEPIMELGMLTFGIFF